MPMTPMAPRPVRIGNAAVNQTQLDVYGEVLDALYHAQSHGLPPIQHGDAIGTVVLEHLAKIWDQPDEGIWEVRGGPQHFVHSKVMAWVAFDRAAKEGKTEAAKRWREIADEIHADVCENGWMIGVSSASITTPRRWTPRRC